MRQAGETPPACRIHHAVSVTMPVPFSAEDLLQAIDGIAYAVDGDGIILGFSRGPFLSAGGDAPGTAWDSGNMVGRSLFDQLRGAEVIECYRRLHHAIWSRGHLAVGFEYRCDTPETERHMRMSLSLIRSGETPVAVLYQSITISETARVPLPLFAADLMTARQPAGVDDLVVKLCSYCQKVEWPDYDAVTEPEWIEASEYYWRGGVSDVVISHAVCAPCYRRVIGSLSAITS
jgi:hypothetical protein